MGPIFNQSNLIKLLMIWFPISFLMVKHGVHISLYGFLLLYLYALIKNSARAKLDTQSIVIAISLSSIFIATFVQQITSSSVNFSALDGPSRLLIAGIVILYLHQRNVDSIKILEVTIPTGLILLWAYLSLNQTHYWGLRWANSFVDPNSLGSQSTILSMVCLMSIKRESKLHINLIKVLGAVCGFYISLKTQSRGGWIVIPFIALCWLVMQLANIHADLNKNKLLKIFSVLFVLILSTVAAAIFVESVNSRVMQTFFEISTWFKDPTIYTSAGARMSMWAASFQLIQENPLGYGETAIKEVLYNHPLYASVHLHGVKDMIVAGPHADILSKGLCLGILGIAAYLLTILSPAILFISKIKSQDTATRNAAHLGLMYVSGVFIAGLFNENLSLKYLCSFYGLMIACLTSQILYNKHSAIEDNY